MSENHVQVWDGNEFLIMSESEAEAAEKADKVQIISTGFVSGLELKFRSEFTGYKTRELRAESSNAAAPAAAPAPEEKVEDKNPDKAKVEPAAKAKTKPAAKAKTKPAAKSKDKKSAKAKPSYSTKKAGK